MDRYAIVFSRPEELPPAKFDGFTNGARLILNFRQQLYKPLPAFLLIDAEVLFHDLRRVHGTELRSAHRAERSFLVIVVMERFVVHRAGGVGIQ